MYFFFFQVDGPITGRAYQRGGGGGGGGGLVTGILRYLSTLLIKFVIFPCFKHSRGSVTRRNKGSVTKQVKANSGGH